MEKFINRKNELKTLEDEYKRKDSSFVVVYGRRRVGKTKLITHFINDKRSIYYLATEENEEENRNSFKNLVAETLNIELLKEVSNASWETIFKEIAKESKKKRIILVIDEFQYLGKVNKAFPSILMGLWDNFLKDSNIMLIICGSLISMMKEQVLNYNSPLYGRRTAQINLKQVKFEYYHEFNEKLSLDKQIQKYAVTGGVPKYIELFNDNGDIYKDISNNILRRDSFLYAEPEFLLQKEVGEIGSYFSILKVIASGKHKLSDIASALNISQTSLTVYLKTLIELEILRRDVPITDEKPEKSKKGLYFIDDNFISFWFKFVYPNKSLLEQDKKEYVEEKIKNNFIDNHVSYVYEDICRENMWSLLSKKLSFNRVGRWWDKNNEIDIVAYDAFGNTMMFGECKYSTKPKGIDVLNELIDKSKNVIWNNEKRDEYFLIYSRSGFSKELLNYAKNNKNIILKELL